MNLNIISVYKYGGIKIMFSKRELLRLWVEFKHRPLLTLFSCCCYPIASAIGLIKE
jgi:hypothetical protein